MGIGSMPRGYQPAASDPCNHSQKSLSAVAWPAHHPSATTRPGIVAQEKAMALEEFSFVGAAGAALTARLERPRTAPRGWAIFAHCFACDETSKAA